MCYLERRMFFFGQCVQFSGRICNKHLDSYANVSWSGISSRNLFFWLQNLLYFWFLPLLSPLIMLGFILRLTPCVIQFCWGQITTTARLTPNQVTWCTNRFWTPLMPMTGFPKLTMTTFHYKIKQKKVLEGSVA